MLNEITLGKWEDWLPKVGAQSVRLVLIDPPYNTTAIWWDKQPVNLSKLWPELNRVLLEDGVIVCMSAQPFTTDLINSNRKQFRYEDIWDKSHPKGHLNAKIMPLRRHENILIFSKGRHIYNPQMRKGIFRKKGGGNPLSNKGTYGKHDKPVTYNDLYYPTSIIEFDNANQSKKQHPNQKPLKLFEYLILTYSNPGDTVLDCFSGSGTTAISALNQGRNFICIEEYLPYWQQSIKRLELAKMQGRFNFDLEEAI